MKLQRKTSTMMRRQWDRWIVDFFWAWFIRRPRRAYRRAQKVRRRTNRAVEMLEVRAYLAAVPLVTTGLADSISASGAQLTGSVNANGSNSKVEFQYSTSPSFLATVPAIFGAGYHNPTGVAVDRAGDVFVADGSEGAVEEISPDGAVRTIGTGFPVPFGVALDSSGDVYVADKGGGNSEGDVEEVHPNGDIESIGSGFEAPSGIAVNAAGDVFVADPGANSVKEVLPSGAIVTLGSGFSAPASVAVDAAGDVFVADYLNNAIKEILPDGSIRSIGSGFYQPIGVAVDSSGDVFVADTNNHAVKEVLPDGTIETLASGFTLVTGVAVDASGDVFAADSNDNELFELSPPTVAAVASPINGSAPVALSASLTGLAPNTNYFVRAVASNAGGTTVGQTVEFTTPDPPALAISGPAATYTLGDVPTAVAPSATLSSGDGEFAGASVVVTDRTAAADPSDSLSIRSSGRLVVNGDTLNYAGATVGSFSGGGSGVLSISFNVNATQAAIATVVQNVTFTTSSLGDRQIEFELTDGAGNVGAPVVQTVHAGISATTGTAANITQTAAGISGSVNAEGLAATDYFQYSSDPSFAPTVPTTIGSGWGAPSGLAVDASGDVFVADSVNNTVAEVLTDGNMRPIGSGFSNPHGVVVDASGDIFVADTGNDAIKEVLPGGSVQTVASGLNDPVGVAVGSTGDVFVAEAAKNAVVEILPDGSELAVGSGFSYPSGVAVDALGNIYVADTGNSAVKQVAPGGAIETIGSGFVNPTSVSVDSSGDVFVTDSGNDALTEILTNGGSRTIGSGFVLPSGVALDAVGDVFVADVGKKQVNEYSPATAAATPSQVNGATATAVSGSLAGLLPGTNYYFRVVASVGGDAVAGDTAEFATPPGPPLLAIGGPDVTYPLGGAPVPIAPSATLTTADGAFANSVLSVVDTSYAAHPSDQLSFASAGNLAVSGTSLTYSGLSIGSFELVGGGTLSVAFNSNATEASVLATVENVVFASGTFGDRSITFQLTDGAGNVGASVTQTVVSTLTTTAVVTPAVTAPPENVTDTGAILAGTINPEGLTVAAAFQYSTDPTFTPTVQKTVLGFVGFRGPSGVAVDALGDVFVADTTNNAIDEFMPDGSVKTIGSGFNKPQGVAVDADGNVFVADTGNNAVEKVLPNGNVQTIGSGFNQPCGVAVDGNGDVFVADTGNNAIKEVLPNGGIQTAGYGFASPADVAVDSDGEVFVADTGHNAVKEIYPHNLIRFIGDGFISPRGVAVDPQGDVYVADTSNNAVKEVLLDGTIETVGAGFRLPGGVAVDTHGDVFVADTGDNAVKAVPPRGGIQSIGSAFSNPSGMAVDVAGDIFLAEQANNVVQEFLPGNQIKTISGFNGLNSVTVDEAGDVFVSEAAGAANERDGIVEEILPDGAIRVIGSGFNDPYGMAVDAAGDLFVADAGDNAVKEILPDGSVRTIGSGFDQPLGVTVDAAGDVFVADTGNAAVKEVLPGGVIRTLGYGFGAPSDVAVNPFGNIFVSDSRYNAVKELVPDSNQASSYGAPIPLGTVFNSPAGVAVDAVGDVFVLETAVVELSPPTVSATPSVVTGSTATAVSAVLGPAELNGLSPDTNYYYRVLASSAGGDVVGASINFITAASVATGSGITYSIGGAAVALAPNASIVGGGPGSAGFAGAVLTVVDTNGGTSDQLRIQPSGGLTLSDNSLSYYGTPIGSFTGGTGSAVDEVLPDGTIQAISAVFGSPSAVAADKAGDLFVADSGNGTVDEVLPGGGVKTIASGLGNVTGVAVDPFGDLFVIVHGVASLVEEVLPGGTVRPIGSGFSNPTALAVDLAGDVYVADGGAGTVIKVSRGGAAAVIGSGLGTPTGVAVDATGDVYVANGGALQEILPNGGVQTVGSGFTTPTSVAVDSAGDVFVLDGNVVKEVPAAGGGVRTIGTGFSAPTGVTVDSSGDVFVSAAATPLIVTFTSQATQDAVLAVLHSIEFDTSVDTSVLTNRQFAFQFANPTITHGLVEVVAHSALAITPPQPPKNPPIDSPSWSPSTVPTFVGSDPYIYTGTITILDGVTEPVELDDPAGEIVFRGIVVSPDSSEFVVNAANVQFNDNVGASGALGSVAVESGGPFVLGYGITATNNIILSVQSSAANDPTSLELQSGATLNAGGQIRLLSSRDVSINAGSTITTTTSTGSVWIAGDKSDGGGASIDLGGTINSPSVWVGTTPPPGQAAAGAADLGLKGGDDAYEVSAAAATSLLHVTGGSSGTDMLTLDGAPEGDVPNSRVQVTVVPPGPLSPTATYVVGSGTCAIGAPGLIGAGGAVRIVQGTGTGVNGGSFKFNADGSFIFIPPANFEGFDLVNYNFDDQAGEPHSGMLVVISPTAGIVWKFYEQVLRRNPELGDLQFYIPQLSTNSPGILAADFFESPEALAPIITGYYQQYLGRPPEGNDVSFWEGIWHQAGGPETIQAQFAMSKEFNALAGDADGRDAAGWITALYKRILNRAPQGNDLPFWEQQLAGGVSEYQVALDFVASLEAYNEDVAGWFNEYLGRGPTAAEETQYANQMLSGTTDRDIEVQITNLAEYRIDPRDPGSGVGELLGNYLPGWSESAQITAALGAASTEPDENLS